jgi:hypothetical protein
MPISPGPAVNTGGFETKTTDSIRSGKEKSAIDTANASATMAARLFEVRVASDPGH